MNNTLTIADIKRRGMAAIKDGLKRGPVHIVTRNKAAAVVLSEAAYQRLTHDMITAPTTDSTAVQWLLAQPIGSKSNARSKRHIDAALKVERNW